MNEEAESSHGAKADGEDISRAGKDLVMSSEPHFTTESGPFGTVGIVGVGLMGGSIGLALKAAGRVARVVGIGRNHERLKEACRLSAIDDGVLDLAEGVAGCDLVVMCTTIGHIVDNLRTVLAAARATAVVTDIGSTKSAIVAAAEGDPRFIGGHPMCGSERTGVEHSSATLYAGATWAVTPVSTTSPLAQRTLSSLIDAVGGVELILAPDIHDAMVAVTSHAPHVIASALIRQADRLRRDIPALPRMSAGSFADMTRVAGSSPSIWRDVCLTNREAVLEALEVYRAELKTLEDAVAAGDAAAIEAFFTEGESAKRRWPAYRG
ncbi:MAG: prephenate dehydrogenase [Capsulimonadaceae bacterium]